MSGFDPFALLREGAHEIAAIVKFGAGMQATARTDLVTSLQGICARCDAAYSTLLAVLVPVKAAYADAVALPNALRTFAASPVVRASFRPVNLCGELDMLISRLNQQLDPLKYSVDVARLAELQRALHDLGHFDDVLHDELDKAARQLDRRATDLADPKLSAMMRDEMIKWARYDVERLEDRLTRTIREMRDVKAQLSTV